MMYYVYVYNICILYIYVNIYIYIYALIYIYIYILYAHPQRTYQNSMFSGIYTKNSCFVQLFGCLVP